MGRKTIGIDVSKATLDYYFEGASGSTSNDAKGHQKLISLCTKKAVDFVTLEATGCYGRSLIRALDEVGIRVLVANPRHVRSLAVGLGKLGKTDKMDAKVITLYGEKSDIEPRSVPTKEEQHLKELSARRQQIVEDITREKNRREGASGDILKNLEKSIAFLKLQLSELDQLIEKEIKENQVFSEKLTKLAAIKGVGPVCIAILLSCLPELGKISTRQVTALCGLAPYNKDSGTIIKVRAIRGGRTPVRNALYMCTLSIIRYDQRFKDYYQGLVAKGKIKKVALIATARKLIISLNAMFKNNQDWINYPLTKLENTAVSAE